MSKLLKTAEVIFGVIPAFGWAAVLAYEGIKDWSRPLGIELVHAILVLLVVYATICLGYAVYRDPNSRFKRAVVASGLLVGLVLMGGAALLLFYSAGSDWMASPVLWALFVSLIGPPIVALFRLTAMYTNQRFEVTGASAGTST